MPTESEVYEKTKALIQCRDIAQLKAMFTDLETQVIRWPNKKDGSTLMHMILFKLVKAEQFDLVIELMKDEQWANLSSPKKAANTMAYELAAYLLRNSKDAEAEALLKATGDKEIKGLIAYQKKLQDELQRQASNRSSGGSSIAHDRKADVFTTQHKKQKPAPKVCKVAPLKRCLTMTNKTRR